MEAFCGLIDRRGEPASPDGLTSMMTAMEMKLDGAHIYNRDNLLIGGQARIATLPACEERKTPIAFFSGTLFNRAELRAMLSKAGCHPEHGDEATLVLYAYQLFGLRFLRYLEGQFSLAIHDPLSSRLILTRDRFGLKPLYFADTPHFLLFSTDIRALLRAPEMRPEVDPSAIFEYMVFRCVVHPATLLKEIRRVVPGRLILIGQNATYKEEEVWNLEVRPTPDGSSLEDYTQRAMELLRNSLMTRISEKEPIGIMLSGGMDSSALQALTRQGTDAPIKSFCIRLEGHHNALHSDFKFARIVAERFRSEHHEVIVAKERFGQELVRVIYKMGEPLNHPNSVSLYLLCKEAAKYIPTLISGDGADGVFGNLLYIFLKKAAALRRLLPQGLASVIPPPLRRGKLGLLYRALELPLEDLILFANRRLPEDIADGVISPTLTNVKRSMANRNQYLELLKGQDAVTRAMYLNLKANLPFGAHEQVMMGSAAGIQVFFPFLDTRLAQFLVNVPTEFKLRHNLSKYLLRRMMKDILPKQVVSRKKGTNPIPLGEWMRDKDCLGQYLPLLLDGRAWARGLFKRSAIERAISDHISGKADNGEVLWILLSFEIWHKIFIDRDLSV